MRLSSSYFYTLRENAKDEDSASGNLLVRAGMIKKSSSGIYMLLPLGLKAIKKIEAIIREEMEKVGAQEVSMPALLPEEVFIESGRRDGFGHSMFSLKDRNNKPFVLGPTHEELFALAANMHIKSYKNLPFSLFQFQTKFRDEPRPRFGLIRVREFTMKDAYTFDLNLEALDKSYDRFYQAYHKVFKRLGLNYVVVNADTGVMGGLLSQEFQALSDIGEDILVIEDNSGYASNLEVAACVLQPCELQSPLEKQVVDTPNAKTIEEVVAFFNKDVKQFVKTLIYKADHQLVALCLRGDHEVNETKVKKLLKVNDLQLASFEEVVEVTNAPVGFAGPLGLPIDVICDQQVTQMSNFIVGANQADKHIINVNLSDFTPKHIADIRNIVEGDLCENGQGPVVFKKGIEVGNCFKLGDKYSKALNLYYTDENNQLQPVIMGSHGIGLGRCLAAIVQQRFKENQIHWPKQIAPIQVAIIVANTKDEHQITLGESLYQQLLDQKYDVLLDDRNERIGVKFKDMELIGAYLTIIVGKNSAENLVEVTYSENDEKQLMSVADALTLVQNELAK